MSRHAYKPTETQRGIVEAMTSYGIPQDAIANEVGCSEPTLRKHFASEIARAQPRANARVAEMTFKNAMNPDAKYQASRFFWLKCRAGWREVSAQEMRFVDAQGHDRKLDIDAVRAYMNSVPDAE